MLNIEMGNRGEVSQILSGINFDRNLGVRYTVVAGIEMFNVQQER